MCRWLAYSGTPIRLEELLVKRDRSLIDQSLHSREGATTTNGDGFGVGWYDDGGEAAALPQHPSRLERPEPPRARGRDLVAALLRAHPRVDGHGDPGDQHAPVPLRNWLWMHNGLIREFPRVRRELVLAIDDSLYPSIEGTTDSEAMFYLALTFGLEDEPVAAVERMVGFVEDTGRKAGVEHPIQMTIATTDGRQIWAFRYSSEGDSRSLYFSTRMDALKAAYPESDELARLSDETRVVVSEPLGDLRGRLERGTRVPRRDRSAGRGRASAVRAASVSRGATSRRGARPDQKACRRERYTLTW